MSTATTIEWTETTWNPTTGCDRVSPGCDNCYALTLAKRLKAMGSSKYQTDGDPRTSGPGFGVALHPNVLTEPLRWRKPRTVFVNSMSDLFHQDVPDEYILDIWRVMARTPQHTYQILTKRHARMRSFVRRLAFSTPTNEERAAGITGRVPYLFANGDDNQGIGTVRPLANVWLGVSVENQQWADIRIPALLETPAAVRFLSCEPLRGPVDLTVWMPAGLARWRCSACRRFYSGEVEETCPGCERVGYWSGSHVGNGRPNSQPIDWVIVGGESGRGARPMRPDWARQLRDQCQAASVPFLFKQWGGRTPKAGGRELDGHTWDEYPSGEAVTP